MSTLEAQRIWWCQHWDVMALEMDMSKIYEANITETRTQFRKRHVHTAAFQVTKMLLHKISHITHLSLILSLGIQSIQLRFLA